MRQYNSLLIIILSAVIILFSCKKETLEKADLSHNYFPVERGTWIEYQVDSAYHAENDNDNDDSVYYYNFQIRDVIDTNFIDGSGRTNQVVLRFRRANDSQPWTFSSVWRQLRESGAAYRTEENITYQKLSFPVNSSVSWNGNAYNTLGEEMYEYDDLHVAAEYGGLGFDSTISVLQRDEDNFVEQIYGYEVYASGVGLIYKERKELGKHNGMIVKGMEYKMVVTAYGR